MSDAEHMLSDVVLCELARPAGRALRRSLMDIRRKRLAVGRPARPLAAGERSVAKPIVRYCNGPAMNAIVS